MKKHPFQSVLVPIIILACLALCLVGDYSVYILVYVFSFVFLFFYTVFSSSTILQKVVQIVIYALIMVAQILIKTLLICPFEEKGIAYIPFYILGLLIVFIPFLLEWKFFYRRIVIPSMSMGNDNTAIPYSLLLRDREAIASNIAKVKKAGKILSTVQAEEFLKDLLHHSSFSYVNNGSLTESYFEKASTTIDDGYVYIVITRSMSTPSEIIGLFTNKQYNHVSISFDQGLDTIISYNGGERIKPPGLNPELLERLAGKSGSSVLIYRLPACCEQKRMILDKVREINAEGSAYNLFGLVLKSSFKPNIMFCSQFVYTMLKTAGLNYFEKAAGFVEPSDFVEADYYRKLEFVSEITYCEIDSIYGGCAYGQTNS